MTTLVGVFLEGRLLGAVSASEQLSATSIVNRHVIGCGFRVWEFERFGFCKLLVLNNAFSPATLKIAVSVI